MRKMTDEEYRAIGKVAHSAAALELRLVFLLASLMGTSQGIALLLVAKENAANLVDRSRKLARAMLQGSPVLDEVLSWLDRAKKVLEQRNATIHAQWGFGESDSEGAQLLRLRWVVKDGQMDLDAEPISVADLDQIARQARDLEIEFIGLLDSLEAAGVHIQRHPDAEFSLQIPNRKREGTTPTATEL